MKRRFVRRALVGAGVALAAWLAAGYATARSVTGVRPSAIPALAQVGGVAVEDVTVTTSDGVTIRAWLARRDSARVVVVLPGVRGSRVSVVPIGALYVEQGWSVLLPDLRGTGASGGERITFGWQERHDLHACVKHLREAGFARVGVHGVSLGAAAIAYSLRERPAYAFVVLESCYDELWTTALHRFEWLPLARVLLGPLAFFTEREIGASCAEMRPVAWLSACMAPTLVLAGAADPLVTAAETQRVFVSCASARKELRLLEGARHELLIAAARDPYRDTITRFLAALER